MNLKNVKDRLKYDTLDLSLCDLKEVPVREIATIKKATNLDLSNNLLTYLPNAFADLKHVVKLDLSKNMLTEIPENFGELRQLKHLDLYANQISRLPLSLSELKNLRWLDLKENPLTSAVASVAGPCSNLNECQACARNIVTYLSRVKLTIEEEKLRRLNNVTMNNEADTVSTKKAAKKKKKKQIDKSGKENLDKNGSNLPSETSATDEGVADLPQLTNDKEHAKVQCERKESSCWMIVTMIAWLFLLCLVFSLAIVILPLYSKQSELFVNSIEANTGIPLKAFHKHATDMIYTCTRYAVNIYDKLYHTCAKNFQTDNEPDIPM